MDWLSDRGASQRLRQFDAAAAVMVDTEFVRERTFYPELALIQVGNADQILLLDAPALGRDPTLQAFLANSTLKVMHSASEDLQAFQHALGTLPSRLFDTQIAAALCGMDGGLSFQKLVLHFTGVSLEKGETRSDWLQRPLSEAQLKYAADDVRYLQTPFEALQTKLRELGREAWHAEDCQRLLDNAASSSADTQPHLAVKAAQNLTPAAQARLRQLLLWRDRIAERDNRPKNWILDAPLAVQLSEAPPKDSTEFRNRLDSYPKSPRKHRDEVWQIFSRTLGAEDLDIPLARALEPEEKNTLKRLQSAVTEQAKRLGIEETTLCSRRHLETLIQENRWSATLNGWRRQHLAAAFAAILPKVEID